MPTTRSILPWQLSLMALLGSCTILVSAVRPQMDIAQDSLAADRQVPPTASLAEPPTMVQLSMAHHEGSLAKELQHINDLLDELDSYGEIDVDELEEDVQLLIEKQGDVAAMSHTGQHAYETLEACQRLYGTLTPDEEASLANLIAQRTASRSERPKLLSKLKRKKNKESEAEADEKDAKVKEAEAVASDDDEPSTDAGQPKTYKEDPGMGSKVFKIYSTFMRIYQKFAGARRQINALASFVAMISPEKVKHSCVLKLIFILYTDPEEEDYPYIPRGCGLDTYLDQFAYYGSAAPASTSCLLWSIAFAAWLNMPTLSH
mmetsp:Transcript_51048/g.94410  ORF Transcript_51048/g.94410 Transcript_51048/m.94410 type:complete len:318 (-) Transcript_51048:90-1043(-)